MAEALEIQRPLEGAPGLVTLRCEPGKVTFFFDGEGTHLLAYTLAFSDANGAPGIRGIYRGQDIRLHELPRVGFNEQLPEDLTCKDFLKSMGLSPQEVEQMLDEYDLSRVAAYACPALSSTAARQLQLLQALRSKQDMIVLNDPFGPFSGRWREHFAERILKELQTRQRIVIALNLGFIPKSWLDQSVVQRVDLNLETTRALEKALRMDQERRKAEALAKKNEAASLEQAAKRANSSVAEQPKPAKEKDEDALREDFAKSLPAPLAYAYKGVYDWIFAPMADFSNRIRNYAGALALLCLTLLVAAMGFVLNPDFKEYHDKMRAVWNELRTGNPPAAEQSQEVAEQRSRPIHQPESGGEITDNKPAEALWAESESVEGAAYSSLFDSDAALAAQPEPIKQADLLYTILFGPHKQPPYSLAAGDADRLHTRIDEER